MSTKSQNYDKSIASVKIQFCFSLTIVSILKSKLRPREGLWLFLGKQSCQVDRLILKQGSQ